MQQSAPRKQRLQRPPPGAKAPTKAHDSRRAPSGLKVFVRRPISSALGEETDEAFLVFASLLYAAVFVLVVSLVVA